MTKHFLYGYFGWHNTGDDAMLYSWIDRMPSEDKVSVLAREPSCTPPGKKVTWVAYSLLRVALSIAKADRFVIAGGTHLSDFGTPRRILVILIRILLLVCFARLLGKYVSFDHIGIVCRRWWSRLLILLICKLSHHISVRDSTSEQILHSMNIEVTMVPDLTYDLLQYLPPNPVMRQHILGISVTPLNRIYHHDNEADRKIAIWLAAQINESLDDNLYDLVRLIVFKSGTRDDDLEYTLLLQSLIKDKNRVLVVPYNPNPLGHIQSISECERVIAMRYHACYFASATGVPFESLSDHPKNYALLKDAGWDQYRNAVTMRTRRIRITARSLQELAEPDKEQRMSCP